MKVAILHHDLEFAEKKIAEVLRLKGVQVEMYDIRKVNIENLAKNDLVLNRIYASVANRDYESISKTLELLKNLEKRGVYCLNSYKASMFDYNKYKSFLIMKKNKIPTPETILIDSEENIEEKTKEIVEKLKLPLILKRNIGGRGKDISRVKSSDDVLNNLKEKFKNAKKENYEGGFIAQEFINSSRDYDCRLGIIDGNIGFSYSRSLISLGSEEKWLASTTNGSVEGIYDAENIEKQIGLKTSNLIESKFNELDIMFTEGGPVIIENNPTPNYFDSPDDHKRIEQFVEVVLNNFDKEKNE
jgi:glutathione synthase/RimK-type ligase-like ATP-grasp enzyme